MQVKILKRQMKAFVNEYSPLTSQFYIAVMKAAVFPLHLCTIQQH